MPAPPARLRARSARTAAGLSTLGIDAHEEALVRARTPTTRSPPRRDDYPATRPKIERKLAHLVRHRPRRTTGQGTRHDTSRCRLQIARRAAINLAASWHPWFAFLIARLDIGTVLSGQVEPVRAPPKSAGGDPHLRGRTLKRKLPFKAGRCSIAHLSAAGPGGTP